MTNNITDEQKKYIDYSGNKDTKLIACAGSGKTFCLIQKINKQIESQKYKSDEILVLTFSRFTKDDFLRKIISYKATFINPKYVSTIDSFAKKIIDINNEIDVSLLSYRLMKYLEKNNKEVLEKNSILNRIKTIYIDESQDLNEIQFSIFRLLKEKLNIIINLVGDPNQNIYQFRSSSDKYLMEFEAKTFYLTYNFRSYKSIINFSKYLRPYAKDSDIVCTKGKNNCKPQIAFHKDDTELEIKLIDILKEAKKMKIEESDIAILSPTRGRMRSYGKSHGLCFISNLLYNAGIKFKQFYEESTDEFNNQVKYKPRKGYINLLTYMGSKGLEWKYVIIIDANNCLINKINFNKTKHSYDQYLLYVACSRAIENMVIFSKIDSNDCENIYKINKWFSLVPTDLYQCESEKINFEKISNYKIERHEKKLFKLIDNFNDKQLDAIASIINYGNGTNLENKPDKEIIQIYDSNYSEIEKYSNAFFGKYTETLFNVYYNMTHNIAKKRYIDIENIINNKSIISNVSNQVYEWYYSNRLTMTWEKFEEIKKELDNIIVETIEKKFNKEIEFKNHTIVTDKYFNSSIVLNNEIIKKNYYNYLKCDDVKKIRKYLFYIIIVVYSINTQHYFHVKSNGKKFKNNLKKFNDLFNKIYNFTKTMDINFTYFNIQIDKYDIHTEAEYIETNAKTNEVNLWKVKSTSEISLKHIINLLMTTILYKDDTNIFNINFINLLKGNIIKFKFNLTNDKIESLKNFFTKTLD